MKAVDAKIAVIDKKIQELKALRQLLKNSIESCEKGYTVETDEANCPLFEL